MATSDVISPPFIISTTVSTVSGLTSLTIDISPAKGSKNITKMHKPFPKPINAPHKRPYVFLFFRVFLETVISVSPVSSSTSAMMTVSDKLFKSAPAIAAFLAFAFSLSFLVTLKATRIQCVAALIMVTKYIATQVEINNSNILAAEPTKLIKKLYVSEVLSASTSANCETYWLAAQTLISRNVDAPVGNSTKPTNRFTKTIIEPNKRESTILIGSLNVSHAIANKKMNTARH